MPGRSAYTKFEELKKYVVNLQKSKKYGNSVKHVRCDKMFFANFSKKRSRKMAECVVVSRRFDDFVDGVYMLAVWEEKWNMLSKGEKYVLILHELIHIPEEGFVHGSKEYKKILDHDIKDFRFILKEFGVDWEDCDKVLDGVDDKSDDTPVKQVIPQDESNTDNDTDNNSGDENKKRTHDDREEDFDEDAEEFDE